MKKIQLATRSDWRNWLAENHHKEKDGIWLIYTKQRKEPESLTYEESVEEALCFGWIDSIIKRIDDTKYCRKFTPRKDDSKWSNSNKKRVDKLIKQGKMTVFGQSKIDAAKQSGKWDADSGPLPAIDLPSDLSEVLESNPEAKNFFEALAPTYRKQFIWWLVSAKRSETRSKRLKESLMLLKKGEKLGLR